MLQTRIYALDPQRIAATKQYKNIKLIWNTGPIDILECRNNFANWVHEEKLYDNCGENISIQSEIINLPYSKMDRKSLEKLLYKRLYSSVITADSKSPSNPMKNQQLRLLQNIEFTKGSSKEDRNKCVTYSVSYI